MIVRPHDQKRRRSDSPQGSARTMPLTPSNGNSGRDPSLEAAVRALLAEDEPEARPAGASTAEPDAEPQAVPPGLTPAQAEARLRCAGSPTTPC